MAAGGRLSDKPKVLTAGTFDLFHHGHVAFLKRCAALGEVTVALNADWFVQQFKHKYPIMSYDERYSMLESCIWVARIVPAPGRNLRETIMAEGPDILAIGSDWAGKDYYAQTNTTQKWLDAQGVSLVYLPYTTEISSSKIIERCQRLRQYSLDTPTLGKSDDPTLS